jgi:hypothetical protein
VSKHKRTRARAWRWREDRERGKRWSARVPSWPVCKEREKKRRKEGFGRNSFEI